MSFMSTLSRVIRRPVVSRGNARRRSGRSLWRRPCLERLEDRLPPGDWLLAALFGPAWLGASLAEANLAAGVAEPAGTGALSAGRAVRPSTWSAAGDGGGTASAPPVVRLQHSEQPSAVREGAHPGAFTEAGGAAAAGATRPGADDLWALASTLGAARGAAHGGGGAQAPGSAAGLGGPAQAAPGDGRGVAAGSVTVGAGSAGPVLPVGAGGGGGSLSRWVGNLPRPPPPRALTARRYTPPSTSARRRPVRSPATASPLPTPRRTPGGASTCRCPTR